jgi:hypothetical protein
MVVGLVVAVERLLLVVMQLQRQARVAQVEMVQHPQLVAHLSHTQEAVAVEMRIQLAL